MCTSIGKRKEAEAEFQGALHGAEMKSTSTTTNKKLDAGRDFDKLAAIGIPTVEE